MDVAKPLEYQSAHDQPRFFQRYGRRIAVLAIVATALLWIGPTYHRLQLSYRLHRCMNFTAATSLVVCDIDASNPQSNVILINADQSNFETLGSGASWQTPTIFLHEMHRPDGQSRLVALNLNLNPNHGKNGPNILYGDSGAVIPLPIDAPAVVAEVWTPRLFTATYKPSAFFQSSLGISNGLSHFKAYAGQPDASDPTHFTFTYEVDGISHTADAWLKNDDSLLVSPRP